MTAITKLLITLYTMLVLLDIAAIDMSRRLLRDFLIGRRNRKSAKKIHSQQALKDRITMDYIEPLLKRYISEFKFFHSLYIGEILTVVPQYIVLIICTVFLHENVRFVLYGVCIFKGLMNLILQLQFDSLMISKYAKK